MGVDAQGLFITKRPLSDEELSELNDALFRCYAPWEVLNGAKERPSSPVFSRYDAVEHPYEEVPANAHEIDFSFDRIFVPGYERGPFLIHITILEWLRRRPLVRAVYYFGDDDTEPVEWTSDRANEAIERWFIAGHEPYWREPEFTGKQLVRNAFLPHLPPLQPCRTMD